MHGFHSKEIFNWAERNKLKSFREQAYKIIDMLAMQANRIPLMKFKDIPINIDMKSLFRSPQLAVKWLKDITVINDRYG